MQTDSEKFLESITMLMKKPTYVGYQTSQDELILEVKDYIDQQMGQSLNDYYYFDFDDGNQFNIRFDVDEMEQELIDEVNEIFGVDIVDEDYEVLNRILAKKYGIRTWVTIEGTSGAWGSDILFIEIGIPQSL